MCALASALRLHVSCMCKRMSMQARTHLCGLDLHVCAQRAQFHIHVRSCLAFSVAVSQYIREFSL